MSFQDLERGSSSRPQPPSARTLGGGGSASAGSGPSGNKSRAIGTGSLRGSGGDSNRGTLPLYHAPPSAPSEEEQEFKKIADRIGIQIFKINSNVAAIEKLVQLSKQQQKGKTDGAGPKGQMDWASRVHDLNDTTRALVKDSTGDIKSLSKYTAPGARTSQQTKLAVAKLQRDFETSLKGFQTAQRLSAERNRDVLEGARRAARASEEGGAASSTAGGKRDSVNKSALTSEQQLVAVDDESAASAAAEQGSEQAQVQLQKPKGPSQSELEFQETLIAEREAEIEEIESGIHELNEIFRDLGHIVQEQGGMIDNIEYNITSIATNTSGADRELVSAHEYQRKAGRRAACLLMIVGIVIAIVLLALLS